MASTFMYRGAVYREAFQKTLYLMRGVSGSGKSTTARKLGVGGVVLSTDDYFMQGGRYVYDSSQIIQAHRWNEARAEEAMRRGISPIVIDNTLVKAWEGKAYVELALKYGYQIKVSEPESPQWRKFKPGLPDEALSLLAQELSKKNVHGVPAETIDRMLHDWEPGVRVIDIMKSQFPY
jgi:NEDD4-binding protein 2